MSDGHRLLAELPAVFARSDERHELAELLAPLEDLLFDGDGDLPGYHRQIAMIPALFAPLAPIEGLFDARTPDHMLGWLAEWLGFAPHRLFPADRLRVILAGIVPLNGSRGTRAYLTALLELAFGDALAGVSIDDDHHLGLAVGKARVGVDARLGRTPPFCFNVTLAFTPETLATLDADAARALRQRLAALIDYAKPGHTSYVLSSNLP